MSTTASSSSFDYDTVLTSVVKYLYQEHKISDSSASSSHQLSSGSIPPSESRSIFHRLLCVRSPATSLPETILVDIDNILKYEQSKQKNCRCSTN